MSRDPAKIARAAFAMASRPELAEGQRAAALNRGMAMVEKYDLNPDDFDIPGRQRQARPSNGKRPTLVIHDEYFGDGFFESIIREHRERVSRSIDDSLVAMRHRQFAEDVFRTTQRDEGMKVRAEVHIFGVDAARIVKNDGC